MSYSREVLTHMIDSKIVMRMFFIISISSQNNFPTLWSQKHGKTAKSGRGVLRDEFLHTSFNSEYDSKTFSFLSLGPKMRSF